MTNNEAAGALIYRETPEFQGDFKRLKKRFRTLDEDFALMKKAAIELLHLRKIDNGLVSKSKGFAPNRAYLTKL